MRERISFFSFDNLLRRVLLFLTSFNSAAKNFNMLIYDSEILSFLPAMFAFIHIVICQFL